MSQPYAENVTGEYGRSSSASTHKHLRVAVASTMRRGTCARSIRAPLRPTKRKIYPGPTSASAPPAARMPITVAREAARVAAPLNYEAIAGGARIVRTSPAAGGDEALDDALEEEPCQEVRGVEVAGEVEHGGDQAEEVVHAPDHDVALGPTPAVSQLGGHRGKEQRRDVAEHLSLIHI